MNKIDESRATIIRQGTPGPWVDVPGPIILGVTLTLALVSQFVIKLYELM